MIRKFSDWKTRQSILVILAHPDDPEFFLGGSIALWSRQGHEVNYWLLTLGEKGCDSTENDCSKIAEIRRKEQLEAAKLLGVKSVGFGGFADGEILPNLNIRKEIVRAIRTIRPNVVVTSDPGNRFHRGNALNHPDHVYAGMNVLDALYPAVNNALYYPDLVEDGLKTHFVNELWICSPRYKNCKVDVSIYVSQKIDAVTKHVSQVGENINLIRQRMLARYKWNALLKKKYYEYFYRITF